MNFHFSREALADFRANVQKEWSLTNGIGGYAGGSIIGALGRTHQGYLIASLHPPVERYLAFAKTNETVVQNEITYDLETSQHAGEEIPQTVVSEAEVPDAYKAPDTVSVAADFAPRKPVYKEGQRYLTGFDYDGLVHFHYEAGDLIIHKTLTLVQGENLAAVGYEVENRGAEALLTITPLMNFREHSNSSTPESLDFKVLEDAHGFRLIPSADPSVTITLACSDGCLKAREILYDVDTQLATEVELETPGLDCHFTPYDIQIQIPANSTRRISLLCGVSRTDDVPETNLIPGRDGAFAVCGSEAFQQALSHPDAFALIQKQTKRLSQLLEKTSYHDEFSDALVIAADKFLSYRSSTELTTVLAGLPWFTDWGRDTMIAFSGLTLSTGRFQEAKEILVTFARYIHNGLVPNMFPDNGQDPLYNTADGSLWYFYAVHQFLRYCNTPEDYQFIQDEIFPGLVEICQAYQNGTDFSIYMDKDGLIHAGSGTDQVTWMDVRVGDWVVTPRHGKPVEINALWYNALKVMEELSEHFGEDSSHYRDLALRVKDSFNEKFWNSEAGCLYDVVDALDPAIRPNQIYAVSLPYTMLSAQREKSIVDVVYQKLYAGCGLRSLSPEDPEYHPIYCGSLPKRDAAYHQGTAWGYLLGGFISAYMKVYGHTPETAAKAMELLAPVQEHLWNGCIGAISEIFDGDAPHRCRGCYAQAWSVGEVLRSYMEDVVSYL